MEEGKNKGTELASRLSDPDTIQALTNLVDRLTELNRVGVLDSFFQAVQSITFMKDGLTDTMVNKNAAMASQLGEIASEAASTETLEALRELKKMHRSGKLKDLADLADTVSFMSNATTEKMLERNAAVMEKLYAIADESASPEILDTVREFKKIHRAGKLKDLFDLTDTVAFMLNSTTEKMIERNAMIMEKLYAMADEAAAPETLEALRTLKKLQQSGNLEKLSEAAYMVSFMSNAVTDSMVQRMAAIASSVIEEVSIPDVTDILQSTTKCVLNTIAQFSHEPPKKGLGNLLSTLRDPEVQKGMIFMATLAKNMQKCMLENYSG